MSDDEIEIDEEQERADAEWFLNRFVMPLRRSIIRGLLAGNDTQCFTTKQYMDSWDATIRKGAKFDLPTNLWQPGAARMNIMSTGLVREVEPDLWAPIEER